MGSPILVTGAAGRVGAIGRTVTELLLKQGRAVRAMVRTEDERAHALRRMGAEVVAGDLLARGLPIHLVNHLATLADLHRAGRYDRMSDDVRALTGQRPLSVREFVGKHAAEFTASAKAA